MVYSITLSSAPYPVNVSIVAVWPAVAVNEPPILVVIPTLDATVVHWTAAPVPLLVNTCPSDP